MGDKRKMTEAGYCKVLLDIKDTKIMELESEITKFRIEYEKQIVKLQKENAELKAQIEKMKSDVIKSFGSEYNVLVAKLLKEWEIKENE